MSFRDNGPNHPSSFIELRQSPPLPSSFEPDGIDWTYPTILQFSVAVFMPTRHEARQRVETALSSLAVTDDMSAKVEFVGGSFARGYGVLVHVTLPHFVSDDTARWIEGLCKSVVATALKDDAYR